METNEKVIEKKVYEEGKQHYATRGTGNAGLTLGIIGTALGGLAAMQLWGRGGLGGSTSLPENVNINAYTGAGSGAGTAPTAFEAYSKGCEETLALTNEIWGLKMNTQNELYAHRDTDIAEKFSLWKGQVDADFGLYKGYRDMGDALNAQLQQSTFALYKGQRDSYDCVNARLSQLEKEVAVNAAIRPYQDKLIQCEIEKAYTAGVNYTDRRTCRMITGEVVLPSTPLVTGYGSYTPCNGTATA
jgi:hypothetical protein